MIRRFYPYSLVFCFSIIFSTRILSQIPSAADTSKGKRLEIIAADRYNFQKIAGTGDFVSLAGNVKIKQELTYFYCDSAVLNQAANTIEAFGNIHINDADSVQTYSQYLKYLGKEKTAYLKKKVRLTDGKAVLTTDELEYNTFTRLGTYVKGGKVVDGTTVLTSQEGYYYGETRDMYFKRKVYLNDPQYKVYTDTLLYNTYTQIARFTVPTKIITGTRVVKTSEGYYDMKNRKAVFGKRPVVDDKDYTLTADDMAFDDSTHFGEAQGSVVYKSKDTANGYAILANNMKSNSNTGAILATQKPLMIIKQDRDSVFVTADTLYSGKLTELEKFRTVPNITDAAGTDTVKNTGLGKRIVSSKSHVPTSRLDSTVSPDSIDINDSTDNSVSPEISEETKNPVLQRDTFATKDTGIRKNAELLRSNLLSKRINSKKDTAFLKTPGSIKNTVSVQTADSTRIASRQKKNAGDSSSDRFFEAYFNVKIFTDSLQAVGDSMFYSFRDSAFRLFKNPVVWAQDNQIVGDTIYLYTENKKPKRFYAFENALAISQVGKNLYNQVKGNTINGLFKNGNIDFVRAKGSAENIYYTADEQGGFIGVNRSTSDVIDVTFRERKPYRVVFRNNLEGTISPMRQVHNEEMRVRGFKWYDAKRPKSKFDLFGN